MKKFFLAWVACLASFANANADDWSNCPATGCPIGFVQWDVRTGTYPSGTNAVLTFEINENNTNQRYQYFYDSNNSASVSKANQLYSTLLTAKTASTGVVLAYQNPILGNCLGGQRCVTVINIP